MRPIRPVCSAFQVRHGWGSTTFCGWCGHALNRHAFLDRTVWSTAGPFVAPGHADDERVPNPDYRPEVAA